MESTKLFLRDPREIPFFRDQARMIVALADECSRGVQVREDDDFGFMAMQFLYKQIQHAESLLALEPRRDAGLIARTMIDGLYQLLWTSQDPEARAQRWRSFSIIHDWRLIQGRLREGIAVEKSAIEKNGERLNAFGHLHLLKKPKPGSSDPYHRKWQGAVTLSEMADVVGRELYDGPYAELSDWEHWGVSGIGESISRNDDHLIVDTHSVRVAGLALLALFQCLVQTLQVIDVHFAINLAEKLDGITANYRATIDSFYEARVL
jgi:Family of unknown function (DUF5677)